VVSLVSRVASFSRAGVAGLGTQSPSLPRADRPAAKVCALVHQGTPTRRGPPTERFLSRGRRGRGDDSTGEAGVGGSAIPPRGDRDTHTHIDLSV